MSPPVVPPSNKGVIAKDGAFHTDISDSTAYKNVGLVSSPTLEDLSEIMPDVAHSLREVLDYKGNVEEDLMLTFQVQLCSLAGCDIYIFLSSSYKCNIHNILYLGLLRRIWESLHDRLGEVHGWKPE